MDRLVPPAVAAEVELAALSRGFYDGHELWTYSYPCNLKLASGYANGPRSSPTVRDDKIYSLGACGNLACLDARSGKVIWTRDLRADYHAAIPPWGVANSPCVEGNLVVVQAGGDMNACVIAFDKDTGRMVWHALSDKPGYASILPIEFGRRPAAFIVWTAAAINSLDPVNGGLYWRHPRTQKWDQAVATPLFDANTSQLFVCSDREGALALQLERDQPARHPLWENFSISCLHSIPVLKDGFTYGLNHDGGQ